MEKAVEKEGDAGKKRDRSNLMEREEAGEASKKIDPVAEFWLRKIREEDEQERAKYPDEDLFDVLAVWARDYREAWDDSYGMYYGPFDRITPVPPMRYTDGAVSCHASDHYRTLQIFSVKIRELRRGLQWPLHVFGIVAVRDTIDHNRNIIFQHQRNNCQILMEEDPYLVLTGPTRAVVVCNPVYFEVVLKLKGSAESEDKELSFLTASLTGGSDESSYSCLINREYTSRLSTLELTFGSIVRSVEATINVQVTDGAWSAGFYGRFTAQTASLDDNIILLDSGDEEVPIDVDGVIKLSRRVASVEHDGELKVTVVAFGYDNDEKVVGKDDEQFRPKRAGKSFGKLDVSFCKMEVTIFWSLISLFPDV